MSENDPYDNVSSLRKARLLRAVDEGDWETIEQLGWGPIFRLLASMPPEQRPTPKQIKAKIEEQRRAR